MILFGYEIALENYERQMAFFKKYQLYVYFLVGFLILLQLFFLLVWPFWVGWRSQVNRLSMFKSTLQSRQTEVLDKENITIRTNQLKQKLQEKEDSFFLSQEYHQFSISTLPQLANNYQLQVNNLKFDEAQKSSQKVFKVGSKQKKIFPIGVTMSLEGDFFNLFNLIQDLEKYPKMVVVKSFQLDRISEDPLLIRSNLELEAYVVE